MASKRGRNESGIADEVEDEDEMLDLAVEKGINIELIEA